MHENLVVGMVLVTGDPADVPEQCPHALIVAINIPLALLFAFAVLFLRGKSANLLSIGAVDFGIIVDSSVIMVENIYRHLSSGENAGLSMQGANPACLARSGEGLFFSTIIMICAMLPLFTMKGPRRADLRPHGRYLRVRPWRCA